MDIEKIKAHFALDRYALLTNVEIDAIAEQSVTCSLEIQDCHLNAREVVQGGAIFTLADFAFAIACNAAAISSGDNTITVSQSCQITFFTPAKGRRLIAQTECLRKGKKISVYRIVVQDDLGTKVAEMTGNAYCVQPKS